MSRKNKKQTKDRQSRRKQKQNVAEQVLNEAREEAEIAKATRRAVVPLSQMLTEPEQDRASGMIQGPNLANMSRKQLKKLMRRMQRARHKKPEYTGTGTREQLFTRLCFKASILEGKSDEAQE